MKKRAFLLPLATALTALLGGVTPSSAHQAVPTAIDAASKPELGVATTLPSDLTIQRSQAIGQKFAQHRSHSSHSSHSSHRSHTSSR